MKASILTIGDEILIGQIVNTNAVWIADQLTRIGWEVAAHSSVGDDLHIINSEFERLKNISDCVLITGGLGPTHDDVTKSALCDYFHDELIFYNPTYEFLVELYARRGIQVSERNKTQAMLPSKCRVLSNSRGTAPGMLFEKEGKIFVSMPGVPDEMKYIMTTHVIPMLKQKNSSGEIILFKTLLTTGITEADLADRIGDEKNFLSDGATLAFLPSYQGVRLRVGAKGKNSSEAEEKISRIEKFLHKRAGKFIFGENDDTLANAVGKILKEKNRTLSVAESCTGGLLGAAITEIPGSSKYFLGGIQCYSNEAKKNFLSLEEKILADFGAVSEQTALQLAENVRKKFSADYGISITGIAGPDGGTPDKPVGTVWIGLSMKEKTFARKFVFGNDRRINRERSVGASLALLYRVLTGNE